MMIVYGIKNCDTVKKARRWLEANNIDYQFHDLRTDGIEQKTIEFWLQTMPWQTLLNKHGTTWRKLDDPRKDQLNEATAVALMLANPTLIKRPVIIHNDTCFVGFKEADYITQFGK